MMDGRGTRNDWIVILAKHTGGTRLSRPHSVSVRTPVGHDKRAPPVSYTS